MQVGDQNPKAVAGGTAEKLLWSRQLLLDLTLRNKLLSFPPGAPEFKDRDNRVYKHLPVIAKIDAVWRRLVDEEKAVRIFVAEEDAKEDWRSRKFLEDGDLGAAFEEEALVKRLVKLFRERATMEELTGDSAFFLALGFLEWREAPPKDVKPIFAPLLLLHVKILQKNTPGGGARSYGIEMDTDEHWGNPCLREKLKAEHDMELPRADQIESPEEYLLAVQAAVAKKSGWRVHRTAALGFFNFTRYRLWLDLDASQWPAGASPAECPLVMDLIDQEWRGDSRALPDDREVAEHQQERDLPVVVDADSTQYAALLAAARGQSLVVIGPPGSGKSQTITNLIAVAIARGKRVLFVAQKLAALEVVQRRLGDVGLSPFCLPLHSHQSKPTDVHRQLRLAGAAKVNYSRPLAAGNGISSMVRSLNLVAESLRTRPPGLEASLAELIQLGCVARAEAREAWEGSWDARLLDVEVPDKGLPDNWIEERTRCLRQWSRFRDEAGDHWQGWYPIKATPPDVAKLEDLLRKLRVAVEGASERLTYLPPTLASLKMGDLHARLTQVVHANLPTSLLQSLLSYAWKCGEQDVQRLHELESLLEDHHHQRDRAQRTLRPTEESPIETATAVIGAAATVAEWVRPNTHLDAVEGLMRELGLAIGNMDDLIANAARFSDGLNLLTDRPAQETLTWYIVEALAALRFTPDMEDRPLLHNNLARALAQGKTNQQDVRDLMRTIEHARGTEAHADQRLPGIQKSTLAEKHRWQNANAKLVSAGIGSLPLKVADVLRSAGKRLVFATDELIRAHATEESALRRVLPELTISACRRLAGVQKNWSSDFLTPLVSISDELLNSLTARLANEAQTPAALRSLAQTLEMAQSLEQKIRKVLPGLAPGDGTFQLSSSLKTVTPSYSENGGSKATIAELLSLRKNAERLNAVIDQATKFLVNVARAVGQPAPDTLVEMRRIAALAIFLTRMPPLPGNGMLDRVVSLADVTHLLKAVAVATALVAKRKELSTWFSFSKLPPLAVLAELRGKLEKGNGKLLRWFSKDYRSTRRSVHRISISPIPTDRILGARLVELESYLQSVECHSTDAELVALTNGQIQGIETDWSDAVPALAWAEEFFGLLGGKPVRFDHLAMVKSKAGTRLEHAPKLVERAATALTSFCETYPWVFTGDRASFLREVKDSRYSTGMLRKTLCPIIEEAGAVIQEMEKLNCPPGLSVGEVAQSVQQMSDLANAIESLRPLQSIVESRLLQIEPAQLKSVADWYERGRQGQLSPSNLLWIGEARQGAVRSLLRAGKVAADWVSAIDEMEDVAPDGRWWNIVHPASAQEVIGQLLADVDDLARDLPGWEPAGLTFNELGELLADLKKSDDARKQLGEWDNLLGEVAYDTDLDLLTRTVSWVRSTSIGISGKILDWCLESETDARLHWLKAMAGYAAELRDSIRRLTKAGLVKREELHGERGLADSRQMLSQRRASVSSSVEYLMSAALGGDVTVEAMSAAGAAMARSCALAEQLATWKDELETDVTCLSTGQVADHRRWAIAARSWSAGLVQWILDGGAEKQYETLGAVLETVDGVQSARDTLCSRMRDYGEFEGAGPADIADDITVARLNRSVACLEAAIPRLLPWADCLREYIKAEKLGLTELMNVAAASVPAPSYEQLAIALRAAVAVRQATVGWQSEQRLVTFRGHEHDRLRREFAAADASLLERNRRRVADLVLTFQRDMVGSENRKATQAMYALLAHEEQKLKRHLPVRRLVERAGPALQEYCPCWLMTPMAVAQFLPPGKIDFDLIIMDEASQLAPEDAWGAIARGKQLVIVGDPKQMPPTDFFSNSVSEEEGESDDEPLSGAKLDSILDTASNCLPHSWLQWHYRSRHQSLIAPANRFSYGERLILFPSAHDTSDALGIKHIFVPNAFTTTGRVVNAKEASAIVERVIQLARHELSKSSAKRLSIGIVSMNAAQQECIQELLDARKASDAGIERALACLEDHPNEPLINRNLENIQGDERDIILISYTYGPNTPGGTPTQRFGPLNFDGGERRFNVLITRAKSRMEVFASIRSDQVQVSGKKAGVQHFHYFLKYAETGTLTDPGGLTQRAPDSPFEEHVMAVLKADGYQVEPQVGVAGYFIDVAVRDPRNPGRFIIGVECDGATYHSSKAARDRDRLREQVLNDRGWKLYRIWSTDWFTNYEASKEALLVAVARTCEGMG